MVKRVGNLMPRIASLDNLYEAFPRAARGKQCKRAVVDFRNRLDENLLRMQGELLDGSFRFGNYQFFTVWDPKRRTICAASFPERVAFHAMMRICHPVFDQYQVYDSYASRIGKGTYKALGRACHFAREYEWFLRLTLANISTPLAMMFCCVNSHACLKIRNCLSISETCLTHIVLVLDADCP